VVPDGIDIDAHRSGQRGDARPRRAVIVAFISATLNLGTRYKIK
jgi:hypothetical protein